MSREQTYREALEKIKFHAEKCEDEIWFEDKTSPNKRIQEIIFQASEALSVASGSKNEGEKGEQGEQIVYVPTADEEVKHTNAIDCVDITGKDFILKPVKLSSLIK